VASPANAVDLTAVSLRRAAGTAVPDGEHGSVRIRFGRGRAVIVEALDGDRRPDPLGDDPRDVDDPLALVDPCFHVVTDSHR
jgi:hypothetical protein